MPSHFLRPRGFHGGTYRCRVASERLDALNQEILTELQVRGIAVPSQTVLRGRLDVSGAQGDGHTSKACAK
jgi:hypothetical protein